MEILYVVLGYLAVPHTIWANKIVIGNNLFVHRFILGLLLGWLLIPWWLVKVLTGRN